MSATIPFSWAVWRVSSLLLVVAVSLTAGAADALFPEPLHITRRIDDPIAGSSITVHEYCVGNRIITVRGDKVAIADYERQQLTEIDHGAMTWTVARFDQLARAKRQRRTVSSTTSVEPKALGLRTSAAGRTVDTFEIAAPARPKLEVGVDRSVALSREALEALTGAAFPNQRTWHHDAIVRAAAKPQQRMKQSTAEAAPLHSEFGLPADQLLTWTEGGETLTLRNVVTAVDRNLPAAELLIVPPGAKQIESQSVTTERLLEQLETITPK